MKQEELIVLFKNNFPDKTVKIRDIVSIEKKLSSGKPAIQVAESKMEERKRTASTAQVLRKENYL
jgi:hypothetical protein